MNTNQPLEFTEQLLFTSAWVFLLFFLFGLIAGLVWPREKSAYYFNAAAGFTAIFLAGATLWHYW